jgi:hypothetical protein
VSGVDSRACGYRRSAKEIEFKNILFATDFGIGAEREAEYAFSFAQEHQANVTLLHVVAHADDYSEEGLSLKAHAITSELAELVPIGGEVWCKPEFRMRLATQWKRFCVWREK